MKRKLTSLLLAFVMLLGILPYSANAQEPIKLWINGNYITTDAEPILENNRTLVPVRVVSEALGYYVDWNEPSKTVIIATLKDGLLDENGKSLGFKIGDTKVAILNAEEAVERNSLFIDLEVPAKIVNNRTFVPIRFIAEEFGTKVDWDADNRTVVIGDGYVKPTVTEPQVQPVKTTNTFQEAKVTRVVDGDTIEVDINGTKQKIRMILVNTPETKHPSKPIEFFGQEASAYTTNELTGKTVYLQKDVSETDRYQRLLRYVWLVRPSTDEPTRDEVISGMFNAKLVANGYGNVSTFPPDVKYVDLFRELESNARNNSWGLWQQGQVDTVPTATTPKTETATPVTGGYIANSNTGKYHKASCSSVRKMSNSNKVSYSTSADAAKAGYVPCKICKP